MLFNRIGFFSGFDCLYDAPGDTGGGGGGNLDGNLGGSDPNLPAEPTVFDVSDDSLIRVNGRQEPVKFGEHFRGFQSQFTKATQEAARLKTQLAERDQRLADIQRQQAAAQQQGQRQSNQPDIIQQLRQMPYLDGEAAAGLADNIAGQIRQRDQILLATLQRMQQMERTLSTLNESHVGASFDGKINRWLQEGGYPPEAADLAKEIYLAYEGNDLDSEFPQIFKQRWEQITRLLDAQRAAKVQANRKPAFVPGRGGVAGPSRPLQLDPAADAKSTADKLWDSLQSGDGT